MTQREIGHARTTSQKHIQSLLQKAISASNIDGGQEHLNGITEEESLQQPEIQNIQQCSQLLATAFDNDPDFKQFKGKLKEYRMKFSQQTQFVEAVDDIEDQDRRDYATFDRLELFKKNHEKIFDIKGKQRKMDTVKGIIRDVKVGAENKPGKSAALREDGALFINNDGEFEEKLDLQQLAQEILHMHMEVKKKNKKLGISKEAKSDTISQMPSTKNQSKKEFDFRVEQQPPSQIKVSQQEQLDKSQILKRYRINLEEKQRLESMSQTERIERKYGLMVLKGPEYLNPALSRKYVERLYIKHTKPQMSQIQQDPLISSRSVSNL